MTEEERLIEDALKDYTTERTAFIVTPAPESGRRIIRRVSDRLDEKGVFYHMTGGHRLEVFGGALYRAVLPQEAALLLRGRHSSGTEVYVLDIPPASTQPMHTYFQYVLKSLRCTVQRYS